LTKQNYHSIEATGGDLEKILQEEEDEAGMPDATSYDQKVVSSALYDGPRSVANVDRGQDGSGDAATAIGPHQASNSNGDPVAQGNPSCTAVPQIVAPEVGNANMPMEDQELEKQEVAIQPTQAAVPSSVDKSRQQSPGSPNKTVPPPLIPQTFVGGVGNEPLRNLMMSWYYAGYYTGLYEGQQQQRGSDT